MTQPWSVGAAGVRAIERHVTWSAGKSKSSGRSVPASTARPIVLMKVAVIVLSSLPGGLLGIGQGSRLLHLQGTGARYGSKEGSEVPDGSGIGRYSTRIRAVRRASSLWWPGGPTEATLREPWPPARDGRGRR